MKTHDAPRMILSMVLVAFWACGGDAPRSEGDLDATSSEVTPLCEGEVLFGRPSAATGLGADQCRPTCGCGGADWEAPVYREDDLAALRAWELETPFPPLTSDPYASALPEVSPDEVCAFFSVDADTYRLETFANEAAALASGGRLTHRGPCGVCSSLENLAAYIANPDLTAPVRECGLLGIREGDEANLGCLRELGFDEPCAQIWLYNTKNTRRLCGASCFALLDAPYHEPDGSLNECLACDEAQSGPVFKAVAGRTRRNTGLANALCRPCSEVTPIVHRYP